jgi:hypothetical protein
MTDRYARIREALAMGPTPGPFSASRSYSPGNQELILRLTRNDEYGITENYCTVRNSLGDTWKTEADAAFIAACDPDTIRALLDERDALREALAALIAWVPSAATYQRLGFDPEALVRALGKAPAALAKGDEQ